MIKIEDVIAIIIMLIVTMFSIKSNYKSDINYNTGVEESNDDVILSKIKNGRYIKQNHASYYSVVQIFENEYGRFIGIGPKFEWITSISDDRLKANGDCITVFGFKFKVIDENTLQYIKPDSPNEMQDFIADGSLYIYQEENNYVFLD